MDCMIDGYSLRVEAPVPYSTPLDSRMTFPAMIAAAVRASRRTGLRCVIVNEEGEDVAGFLAGERA